MEKYISGSHINAYIDVLTNQVFSILPFFEENGNCETLSNKIDNINLKFIGFFKMIDCDSNVYIEILSLMKTLQCSKSHIEIRRCVLKICSLLSSLKVVDGI